MSDAHLPDDIRRWPEDPYELLAVDHTIESRELRRAYTRLIRRFKPEHHPDEFRRIREAYEIILQQVEWRERFAQFQRDEEENETDDGDNEQTPAADNTATASEGSSREPVIDKPAPVGDSHGNDWTGNDSSSSDPARPPVPPVDDERWPPGRDVPEPAPAPEPARAPRAQPRPLVRSLEDQLDELWQQVCDGQERPAYERLLQLVRQHANSSAVYVRLYWLLRVAPEVDPPRRRVDWVLAGLCVQPHDHLLTELYRREIERAPELAFDPGYEKILLRELDSSGLVPMYCTRWQAAAQLDRWEKIAADLESLRTRLARRDEPTWGVLLMRGVERLFWTRRVDVSNLSDELDALPHFQIGLADELGRLDYLRQVAAEYHALTDAAETPKALLQLLPLLWHGPDEQARYKLLQMAERCVESPEGGLRLLDAVGRHGRTIVAVLTERLEALSTVRPGELDPLDPETERELVHNFFSEHPAPGYANLRPLLLRFCVSEAISPANVVGQIDPFALFAQRADENLARLIEADVALRAVYAAHEAIWI